MTVHDHDLLRVVSSSEIPTSVAELSVHNTGGKNEAHGFY